jgi:uncharacterized membrane protein YwaF
VEENGYLTAAVVVVVTIGRYRYGNSTLVVDMMAEVWWGVYLLVDVEK